MPYITDDQLKSAIAAASALGSGASLPAYWDQIAPSANTFAYSRIRSVLFDRGFSPAQVDAWDDRVSWSEQIGVCVAFWRASKTSEDRGEAFRREYEQLMTDLVAVRLVIGGVIVDPAGRGLIGTGPFDTSCDIHKITDVL